MKEPTRPLDRSEVIARLKWAWQSRSLFRPEACGMDILQKMLAPFDQWEAACDCFLDLQAGRKTQRLGETFELLMRSCFEVHPRVSEVIANLALPAGEIDLLFSLHDEPMRFHAIELSVKFYLFDASIEDPMQRWIGPARKDTYFRKARRVFDLQVPRAFTPEALQALQRQVPGATIVASYAWTKGELFASANDIANARATLALFPQLDSDFPLSPCIEEAEFKRLSASGTARMLRDRWNWICEVDALSVEASERDQLPSLEPRAEMALVRIGSEKRRAFVTPENWRDRHPPKAM